MLGKGHVREPRQVSKPSFFNLLLAWYEMLYSKTMTSYYPVQDKDWTWPECKIHKVATSISLATPDQEEAPTCIATLSVHPPTCVDSPSRCTCRFHWVSDRMACTKNLRSHGGRDHKKHGSFHKCPKRLHPDMLHRTMLKVFQHDTNIYIYI